MNPKPWQHRDDGFTLIEVLIALVVLTIGVLSVNAMQTASIRGNASANRVTLATSWGTDATEHLLNMPFDAGSNGSDDDGDGLIDEADEDIFNSAHVEGANPPGNYTLAWFASNGQDDDGDGAVDEADEGDPDGYRISWTVRNNTPINNVQRVIITVSYTAPGDPTPKTVTFNSLKTRI